ncbi:hypothetical protein BH11BAC4_BH11BAC4_02280 [soil metagenome]
MDLKKFALGGIIAGIAHFFLGWLVWGILLMNIMLKHTSSGALAVFRESDKMIWWAMIAGNLAAGFLLCYILMKSAVRTVMNGAVTGAVVGLLNSVAMNCIAYAQMKIYGKFAMTIDVIASIVVVSIVGAILGWFLGRGPNAS